VCELVNEHRGSVGWRERFEDRDAAWLSVAVSAAKIRQPRDHHTSVGDRLLKSCEIDAWIAGLSCAMVGSGSPSVCAMPYLWIPQPGHSNAAVVAEADTCMARIRGARGDAFRTGLPRLFKTRWPVLEAGSLR
jgi:hypothetical protein